MIQIPLFALKVFTLIWWLKFNFSSRYKPRYFKQGVQATSTVLKLILLVFLENITSCACLVSLN